MRRGLSRSFFLLLAFTGACVGSDPAPGGETAPGTDGGGSGSSSSSSSGGSADGGPTTSRCTSADDRCVDGTTLETCRADGMAKEQKACALGCATAPSPHCKDIVPSAPVTLADLDATGLAAITIATDAELDSDTGAITGSAPRAANADPNAREVKDGVAMHLVPIVSTTKKLAIFSVASFTINAGATLTLRGSNPVAIVSAGDVTINGLLDARGTCIGGEGGPGAGSGGTTSGAATGAGAGSAGASNVGYDTQGGAGGGFGDRGGKTSASGIQPSLGGSPYGNEGLVPLVGGSGGGRGGDNNNATGGNGGGGGGALMIVARTKLVVGGGPKVGGINAGGCGGSGGKVNSGSSAAGGGGGGSGGAVLVEAPSVEIIQNGAIAANGGGGAAGSSTGTAGNPGSAGTLALIGAEQGVSGSCGSGGRGGSVNDGTLVPAATTYGATPPSNANGCGGGGGGGAGRLRFNTLTGSVTFQGNGFTSPRIAIDLSGTGSKLATGAPLTTQ